MTGTVRSSAGLEPRRKRLLFRSWHRGTREMDLILGSFADAEIARLTTAELDQYEQLLELQDADLLAWITSGRIPEPIDTPLFRAIVAASGGVAKHVIL